MLLVAGSLTMEWIYRCAELPSEGGFAQGSASIHIGGLAGVEALAAMRSGAQVLLLSAVGNDDEGARIRKLLHEHGVDAFLQVSRDAPSGSGACIVNDEGRYIRSESAGANALLNVNAEAEQLLDRASLLLCQCDANTRASGMLMNRAASRGIRRVLHASPARPEALAVLAPLADLIIANPESLCALGRQFSHVWQEDFKGEHLHALSDTRLHELCRSIVPCDVVLLLGARGAFVSRTAGTHQLLGDLRAAVRRVQLRCAEELFVGGLCARLAEGADLIGSVRYGVCASAIMPLPGGQDAIPRKSEVLATLE